MFRKVTLNNEHGTIRRRRAKRGENWLASPSFYGCKAGDVVRIHPTKEVVRVLEPTRLNGYTLVKRGIGTTLALKTEPGDWIELLSRGVVDA